MQPARLGQDKLVLSSAGSLTAALENAPTVRPEKVEQARALVQDHSYPPQVLIRKLSDLLAIRLAVGAKPQASDETETSAAQTGETSE